MAQRTSKKISLSYLAAIYSHAYHFVGIRLILGELLGLPLIIILIGAVWALGWDWRLLFLFPLALLCSLGIADIRNFFSQTSQTFEELVTTYRKFSNCHFTHYRTEDYIKTLYGNSSELVDKNNDIHKPEFAKSMLSSRESFFGNYLRLIVIETDSNVIIPQLSTFAMNERAWIFLNENPQNMDGIQHFNVLHEIGHTNPYGMAGYSLKGVWTNFLISLPVIVLMVKWEVTSLILLVIFIAIFLSFNSLTIRWIRRRIRFVEELYADDFALERCPKHWFKDFSQHDIKDFAEMVCGNLSFEEEKNNSSTEFDAPMTTEQVKWRQTALINKIKRKLEGDNYEPVGYIPELSIKLIKFLLIVQQLILISLLVTIGLQHAELTTIRFIALIAVMLLIMFVGIIFGLMAKTLANHWDIKLGLKRNLTKTEQNNLDYGQKGFELREKFELWRHQKKEEKKDRNIDVNFTPPGINGILFLPEEIDLYVNREKLEAYIFHGKVIDYDISHLEYYSQNHSVVIVMNNGNRFDLGVRLQWLVRPYFLKAKEINIVRTENRKSIEKVIVPLQIM
jgi:hypothetical protein